MPVVISRKAAHVAGLKRFFTGEPCVHGHVSERYVSSGNCIECVTFKTPNKPNVAHNAAWPRAAFVFQTQPAPTQEEMQAAIRYVQEQSWHDVALQQLRANPQLMAQYVTPPTPAEIEAAEALLAHRNVTPQRVKTGGLDTPEKIAARNARLQGK